MPDAFNTVRSELPRDRWGRPLITPPGGGEPEAYQRVTTFVGPLEDTFFLTRWKQSRVALGMASRRDLQLAVSAITDPSDQGQKRTLNQLTDQAFEAGNGSSAASIGTALHSFTELIDQGRELPSVPEEYVADLEAYRQIMQPFGIVAIEGFCVCDDLRVGGSYDRILSLPEGGLVAPDGKLLTGNVIGDLKTGGSVDLGAGKIAMQLGVYANSEDYDHTLGTRTPLPGPLSKEWAIVIHLPAGTGTARLVWFDIKSGWETARDLAPKVHAWRKRRDLTYEFASVTASAVTPNLVEQINAAASPEELRALYFANSERWTPGLTSLAASRVEALKKVTG